MSSDEFLLRRYRKSFVAIGIFILYAVALLAHNLSVRERLQQNLIEAAQLDLVRRADALSYYFTERHNDLTDLAESEVVASYFGSVDLGMTADYGLAIQIQAIDDKFSRLIERKRLGFAPIYNQLTLADDKGAIVAQVGDLPDGATDAPPTAAAPRGVELLDDGARVGRCKARVQRRIGGARAPRVEADDDGSQDAEPDEGQRALRDGELLDGRAQAGGGVRDLLGHQACILMISVNASTALLRTAAVSSSVTAAWLDATV